MATIGSQRQLSGHVRAIVASIGFRSSSGHLPVVGPHRPLPGMNHIDGIRGDGSVVVPSLDVIAPDGERITVRPHSADDRVCDLLRALGAPLGCGLVADGTPLPEHRRLVDAPQIRVGARLALSAVDPPADRLPGSTPPVVHVAVTRGRSCTPWVGLPVGRHRIGRAAGSAVVIDGTEPHHGVLDVAADSSVAFTQLTGRVPVLIDGEPTRTRHPLADGTEIGIGSSLLAIRREGTPKMTRTPGTIGAASGNPWGRVVQRAPALEAVAGHRPLVAPAPLSWHPMPPATGLIGAGVGIGGALAIATLLGQPMFALFALIGGLASFSTWLGGVVVARRGRRRALARDRADSDRFEAAARAAGAANEERHRLRYPSLSTTLDVHDRTFELAEISPVWSRAAGSPAPAGTRPPEAVIGDGDVTCPLTLEGDERSSLASGLQVVVDRAERLASVPVPIMFERGTATAMHGEREHVLALARSIIVQLGTWLGPSDLRLAVVTDDAESWRWCEWLPHMVDDQGDPDDLYGPEHIVGDRARLDGWSTGRSTGRREEATDERGGRLLVVVDTGPLVGSFGGTLGRLLAERGAAALVLVDEADTVPSICRRVLVVGATGSARWLVGEGPASAAGIRVAGIDVATAERVARNLAPLVDPEVHSDSGAGKGDLPSDLRLGDLEPDTADPLAIVDRWRTGGADPRPAVPVGRGRDGVIEIDLVRDGPHGLIAGTTGAGKSELLRTLVVGLAARLSPDHLTFVLVDYKGGSTFDACVDLPHTVGLVTDLDDGLAERALVSLEAELARRERLLRDTRAADLTDYRSRVGVAPLPRIVVVVDEFATLARELPGFLGSLIGVAQRGRSLGVHLLLATQRPAGVVDDDIRANTNLRLALRLNDGSDAHDVVGDDLPARFPRDRPGRVAMRLGPDELVTFQAARCTAPARREVRRLRVERGASHGSESRPTDVVGSALRGGAGDSELSALVAAIGEAATLARTVAPHRPWHDPLPESIEPDELEGLLDPTAVDERDATCDQQCDRSAGTPDGASDEIVGVIDDPESQCRRPLRWGNSPGNLALIGSLGSGTTSALVAVATARCEALLPERCHLYVIDGGGDAMLDGLDRLAHCGGVVKVQERERLARLLARLVGELDSRTETIDTDRPQIVLLVDRLGAVRSALGTLDEAVQLAQLDRVLGEGPGLGITTAFTIDGTASATLMTPAGERWVFHIDDASIARGLGAGRPVAADIPGRLRLASTGLHAQVAVRRGSDVTADAPTIDRAGGPDGISTLPSVVTADGLCPARICDRAGADASTCTLAIGLGTDDLHTEHLRLPAGEHVFIAGLARTGRSTALARVAGAWSATMPSGRVVTVSRADGLPRESLRVEGAEGTAGPPILVVIDDAERFDDPDGLLREVIGGAYPHVTVAIAAGLDAVRSSYGHWTREIARSRCGIIMTAASEIDGDLLGVTLPRRTLVPARPGLGWLVDGSGHRLVQVAIDDTGDR
jgi:S-DNA-T family DNA segregation ATPase FtsK/SpoIIIE